MINIEKRMKFRSKHKKEDIHQTHQRDRERNLKGDLRRGIKSKRNK